MADKDRRWRVNTGIDYVLSDADHKRVVDSVAKGKSEEEHINPFDPEQGIKMRRIEPGRVVHNLPDRVIEALAGVMVEVDGELRPAIEDEDERVEAARLAKEAEKEEPSG